MINIFHFAEYEYFFSVRGDLFLWGSCQYFYSCRRPEICHRILQEEFKFFRGMFQPLAYARYEAGV
jgi:hypothetical protein